MMRRNLIETVMGAVVLLVAGLFLWLAYTSAHVETPAGYDIMATFGRAGGIAVGSDVECLDVGLVAHLALDAHRHRHGVAVLGDLRRLDRHLAVGGRTLGQRAEPLLDGIRRGRGVARRHHAGNCRQPAPAHPRERGTREWGTTYRLFGGCTENSLVLRAGRAVN